MSKHGTYAVPGEREARPSPQRGRKNRRRWCKGKKGVDHVPAVVLSHHALWRQQYTGRKLVCRWVERHHWVTTVDARVWTGKDEWDWHCLHEQRCGTCGKVLSFLGLGRECPDFTERVVAD